MNAARYLFAGYCLTVLAGCASLSPETEPDTAAVCPEPIGCPVCETPPEPEACPAPQVVEKIVEVPAPMPPMAKTAGELHLPIIGTVEQVLVEPANVLAKALIDTGEAKTVMHAEDIQLVEKEGKRHVRFNLLDADNNKISQELPLRRRETAKTGDGESSKSSYIVRMWLTLGETRSRVDVRLADRGEEEFPVLLGRNFLLDAAIVDVSRRDTQPAPAIPSP